MNESDIYAAETFEEAVAVAIRTTGLPRDDVVDPTYAGRPIDLAMMVRDEDGAPTSKTIGDFLAEMTEPGVLLSWEV